MTSAKACDEGTHSTRIELRPLFASQSCAPFLPPLTRQVDVIARAEILGADGSIEVLEGTTVHPIWSLDRNEWVPLGEIEVGEQLASLSISANVLRLTVVNRPTAVYNIEVHGEHVYQVGELGLLVHNAYNGDLGAAVARGMTVISGPTMADQAVEIAARLGKPMTRQQIREIIHLAKDKMNIGAAEDLVLDLSGGMWDSRTGELIGKLWDAL
jgi:hypothetical protein